MPVTKIIELLLCLALRIKATSSPDRGRLLEAPERASQGRAGLEREQKLDTETTPMPTLLRRTSLEPFWNARLARTKLARARLARTKLAGAELARAKLARANLARTELAHTELTRTKLARTELARRVRPSQGLLLSSVRVLRVRV